MDTIYYLDVDKDLGGYSSEVPPLPIPNREVKLAYADGTAFSCGRVGSRLFKTNPNRVGLFFVCSRLGRRGCLAPPSLVVAVATLKRRLMPPPFVLPIPQTPFL